MLSQVEIVPLGCRTQKVAANLCALKNAWKKISKKKGNNQVCPKMAKVVRLNRVCLAGLLKRVTGGKSS
jgi:hypothetical protein